MEESTTALILSESSYPLLREGADTYANSLTKWILLSAINYYLKLEKVMTPITNVINNKWSMNFDKRATSRGQGKFFMETM